MWQNDNTSMIKHSFVLLHCIHNIRNEYSHQLFHLNGGKRQSYSCFNTLSIRCIVCCGCAWQLHRIAHDGDVVAYATMFMEWSAAVIISNDRWKDSIYGVVVKNMKLRFSQNLNLGLLNAWQILYGISWMPYNLVLGCPGHPGIPKGSPLIPEY